MKLEIVSGQPGVELKEKFANILKQNGLNIEDPEQNNFLIFPELDLCHPKILYDNIRERVRYDIGTGNDLFILTYSDYVFNAVRVEIKRHKFEGSKVHQFTVEEQDICSNINKNGNIEKRIKNIFDVWARTLIDLALLDEIQAINN